MRRRPTRRSCRIVLAPTIAAAAAVLLVSTSALADPTPPVTLSYVEGDFAGATAILSEDGKRVLGFTEYRQSRHGDRLHVTRKSRFKDGSSDEDEADVTVGAHLDAIGGRSIIRDKRGKPIVDLKIDVAGKRVSGFYVDDGKRESVDEEVDIGPGTYWGPLFNIVLKNFDANAKDGKLVFQAVLPTPKPRVMDMELVRTGSATVKRIVGSVPTTTYSMLPTINFLIDPVLRRFVPKTEFFLDEGKPPALARFVGPRNYAGQIIRLE
jgi:hypothetical protein